MTKTNDIKRTGVILRGIFLSAVALAVLMVVCFECGLLTEGGCAGAADGQTEFVLATVMELLTLCVIPVALRMFKVKKVSDALSHSPRNLLRYGSVRILLLAVPLVVNTFLYYIYMSVAFGYMAIILLLAMAFVYPSASRCEADIDRQ